MFWLIKKKNEKKVNKQRLLDTFRTFRVSEKTEFWQVIVQTADPSFEKKKISVESVKTRFQ